MSGVAVDAGGGALSYFALAPGGTYNHYGVPDIIDKLLLSSQDEVITLAGLYFSWRNNSLPLIPMILKANNRLIDIFPNSKCTTTIASLDNVRGIGYSGGLYPETITVNFDDTTGRTTRTVEFRTETFESLAIKETVPGSGDVSTLPNFKFPPLPTFPPIPGGLTPASTSAPRRILGHDPIIGLFYTSNGGASWITVNSGLTTAQYQNIQQVVVTPSGAVWVACSYGPVIGNSFVAYTPAIGTPFTVIYDQAAMAALVGHPGDTTVGLVTIAKNPLAADEVGMAIVFGVDNAFFYRGIGGVFTAKFSGASINLGISGGKLSYGTGAWLCTYGSLWLRLSADLGTLTASGSQGGSVDYHSSNHARASSSGKAVHWNDNNNISLSAGNGASFVNNVGGGIVGTSYQEFEGIAIDPTGFYLMARRTTGTPIKSSDGGSTWVTNGVTYLPPFAIIKYQYVAGDCVASCWIAGEFRIWYSSDFGITWLDITSNLHALNAFLATDVLEVVGI